MNYLKFDNDGGLLAFQEMLAFMQTAYTGALDNITALVGNSVILEGCVVVGGNVSNGTVILNGELLPFEGGVQTGFVTISETVTSELYSVGGEKPFYVNRKAMPAAAGIPFADLVRLDTLKSHYANKSNPHQVNKTQVGLGNLPNAKSDAVDQENPNQLATSKAVHDVLRVIKGGTYTGTVNGYSEIVVTHNANLVNYSVMLTNTSASDYGVTWQGMFFIAANKTLNTFTLRIWPSSSPTEISIDWIIFPR